MKAKTGREVEAIERSRRAADYWYQAAHQPWWRLRLRRRLQALARTETAKWLCCMEGLSPGEIVRMPPRWHVDAYGA